MRELNGAFGSLSFGIVGVRGSLVPLAPGHAQGAAAFFDSLIGQQDRHMGNFRWDDPAQQLHLIDHGYAFPRPGDHLNASVFVEARWRCGGEALSQAEAAALGRLLGSSELFGLTQILEHPRADYLAERAKRMLGRGTITRPGDF